MNIIDKVIIEGLWGGNTKSIEIRFDENFNFLIGRNGTGKTTVINLITAALVADFERLDKTTFSRIYITLKSKESRKKPSIEITKTPKPDVPYYDITYIIKKSAREPAKNYDLDALAEEQFYRGIPPRALRERVYKEKFIDIKQQLQSMITVCWLSVHRHNSDNRIDEERRGLPAIDQKLSSLNTLFLKYFLQLTRQFADHTKEFQKNVFLSLLTNPNEQTLISQSNNINIEREYDALANVFDILGVESTKYSSRLKTHFDKFQDARVDIGNAKFTTKTFAAIYNALKTHSLVQYYEDLEQRRAEIFRSRDNFIEVVNELFDGRKYASISERNEIIVKTSRGQTIPLEELSSGEKQLIIILGEALLQENASVIYIADEPELSLHVRWQERLTSSISKLNPNAQIVFATHSPDIVSIHSNKIIDMESIIE